MQDVTPEFLQSISTFAEVPLNQLQWFIDNSRHYEVPEGEYLFHTGQPIPGTHVLVKGRVRALVQQLNTVREVAIFPAHEVFGYLPFSRGINASLTGQVVDDSQLMTFPVDKMKELINHHYELTQALVHKMTSRVRDYTTAQQQDEKMMALGKLSAGLAHELNNPAAAIVRGSNSLLKHLQLAPQTLKKIVSVKMTEEQVDEVNTRFFEVLGRKEKPILTLMQRTSLEDDLADCLQGHGVDNSQELAENFIDFGFTCDDTDNIAGIIPSDDLNSVLNWLNNNLVTERMVIDIREASQRIEKLVSSVKNYTHMDRDRDKEFADIHLGIRNTLTMLGYKLKKGNIHLNEEYDTSLPPVKAYIGELNQVWTNIIDNAIDAMEVNGNGELQITTKRDNTCVEVSIADNGPGIPENIQNRIFEPFFTTKQIGKGTGLGLDVVRRIVDQHGGSLKIDSHPGRTAFTISFPING